MKDAVLQSESVMLLAQCCNEIKLVIPPGSVYAKVTNVTKYNNTKFVQTGDGKRSDDLPIYTYYDQGLNETTYLASRNYSEDMPDEM